MFKMLLLPTFYFSHVEIKSFNLRPAKKKKKRKKKKKEKKKITKDDAILKKP